MTKESKGAFSASHNLLKFRGTFRVIIRLLVLEKVKCAMRAYDLATRRPLQSDLLHAEPWLTA